MFTIYANNGNTETIIHNVFTNMLTVYIDFLKSQGNEIMVIKE